MLEREDRSIEGSKEVKVHWSEDFLREGSDQKDLIMDYN
jgi:hypothetical protein